MLADVKCDRCDESMQTEIGNVNGIQFLCEGGYDSTHFPDGEIASVDVCEKCVAEWFVAFKRNPLARETDS